MRLDPDERVRWEAAASERGLTLAEFVRLGCEGLAGGSVSAVGVPVKVARVAEVVGEPWAVPKLVEGGEVCRCGFRLDRPSAYCQWVKHPRPGDSGLPEGVG